MHSIWEETASRPSFEALKGNKRTDVLIIGGGMTGLLCAHWLKKAGVDCLLVEADRICGGVTANTTAKITLLHGLLYDRLLRRLGEERARLFLQAQRRACDAYGELCGEIPCDYERKDAYVYSLRDPKRIEREVAALNRLGCAAEFSDASALPFVVSGAVRVKGEAQFHPLKFAFEIARDLPICESTKVLELRPNLAVTSHGEIRCERMIVATHFPFLNKHGAYFLKLYQYRSYVLALKGAGDVEGMYVDEAREGLSLRSYGDLLLLGGGAHRTGKQGGGWSELEDFARTHYPKAWITAQWATQDCMTLDALPYVGQYARSTPSLFVATGYQKWGMSSSMMAAMLLTDLLLGRANKELVDLLSPSRSVLHPQLALNAAESVIGLLTPTVPRCPHLGCALKYNREEHSWDCPCHGSRFGENGELLDNPATDDKKMP